MGDMRRDKECSDRTVSLEDQRARIAAYCAERDGVLAETLADDEVSAGNRERLSFAGSPVRASSFTSSAEAGPRRTRRRVSS